MKRLRSCSVAQLRGIQPRDRATEQPVISYPFPPMSDEPEYLICLQCDTPTYQFEYVKGKLAQVVCNTCGADDPSDFLTEAELEEQS
ncbi:MAG: hypothetical protein DMF56_08760 [Acidobacteria bacterium]|nr:MAG: hypothetical protein DMF56_08760 [Acidobacteriota bacterium]